MDTKRIIAVVALPPPVHGQSVVNRAICRIIGENEKTDFAVFDISPKTSSRGIRYHFNRLYSVARTFVGLIFNFSKNRNSVFYFVYESGFGVIYNLILCVLAKILNGKVFLHHHTAFHTLNYKKSFSFLASLIGNSGYHVVLSERMKEDLSSLYEVDNIIVLGNSVFLPDDPVEVNSSAYFNYTIGFISNLTVEKGSLICFSTIRKLASIDCRYKLIVAGPVSDELTKKELECLLIDYPNNVSYLGAIYGDEKKRFYQSIDLLIFPSKYRYEAQPLVILEALSFGVPCIVTPQGYSGEVVEDLDIALVVNSDSFMDRTVLLLEKFSNNICLYREFRERSISHYQYLRAKSHNQLLSFVDRVLFS